MSPPNVMAHREAASSQETTTSKSISPQRPPLYRQNGSKERRNSSITPRRFTRFFTPTSLSSGLGSARRPLHDITAPNPRTSSDPLQRPSLADQENDLGTFPRAYKKRKRVFAASSLINPELGSLKTRQAKSARPGSRDDLDDDRESNYIPSSPCARIPPKLMDDIEEQQLESVVEKVEEVPTECLMPPTRIIPLRDRGLSAQLMQLSFDASTGPRRSGQSFPIGDWRSETASFCTGRDDVQLYTSVARQGRCIPFCTTGLNTNSLVAVGDEDGQVRLLDSEQGGVSKFKDTYHSIAVHLNAIIDMAFTEDDSLLATASGDQTARVVDMTTQTTISVLLNHTASLKQIRFQPGANNTSIVATSSRDGSVQIWDLRCKGNEDSVLQFHPPVSEKARNCYIAGSVWGAHRHTYPLRTSRKVVSSDTSNCDEQAGRVGDVSITALSFLPPGQEHFLLTGSEMDSSLKLWDIRTLSNRRKNPTPISHTRQPQSHSQFRRFGINSINVSSDGSRAYSLCKDNSVYAYSTAHLVLGHAPELSSNSCVRAAPQRPLQEGLGPIYCYRHPQFHATSFYVKSSLRKAKDGKCEMLAVGSSDGCAVLFPTDERYFPKPRQCLNNASRGSNTADSRNPGSLPQRPALTRTGSGLFNSRIDDMIPVSHNGTPLIKGHDREVGALTWTADGHLVTLGDDFLVRCWKEDGEKAKDLRAHGWSGVTRWGSGWADVGDWDADED